MLSCDTFALTKNYFARGKNCLAKNSDRPLGEAQPLSFFPGGTHAEGALLQCTHLTIPQVPHTYTVLGSRPHWIWGFEMGVNEMGLAIGNEAEGSRCEKESAEGLLGMDLLRLALERAATAREGVQVIAGLLEQYGQNANASQLSDRRYENSFMLVDPQEIWLMETAGRHFAARQVTEWAAISNCYSIGKNFDYCSQGLEAFAREKRWLRPGEEFHFAKAYTRPALRQERSVHRWRRMQKLIAAHKGALHQPQITAILRDHYEDELIHPLWGGSAGTFMSVCMHAATLDGSQTAASMISFRDDILGPITWYAPSMPCCSLYLPVYWTENTPLSMQEATGVYAPDSLWWAAQRLGMLVSVDEERFGDHAKQALRALEAQIDQEAEMQEEKARALMQNGKKKDALQLLTRFTEEKTEDALQLFRSLANEISKAIDQDGGLYGIRKEFLEDYAQRTHLPL